MWGKIEARRQMSAIALAALHAGTLPGEDGLPGSVRALDVWLGDRYGAALFRMGAEAEVWGYRQPVLLHVNAERLPDDSWRPAGAGAGAAPAERRSVSDAPALTCLGGCGVEPLRLTVGIGAVEVAAIRVRNVGGSYDRPLGRDGFFVVGVVRDDPETYAYALDPQGNEMACDPLRL